MKISHRGRGIQLYGGGDEYRLSQEIVLGMGGVAMLKALGHKPKDEVNTNGLHTYHMNEGHSALLTLRIMIFGCSNLILRLS